MENLAWRLMAIKTGAVGVGEEQKSGLIKDIGGTEDAAMKPLEQPLEVQRRERQDRSKAVFGESRSRSKSNPMLMNLTQAQVQAQAQTQAPGLPGEDDSEPLSAPSPLHSQPVEEQSAVADSSANVSRTSSCLEVLLESDEVHVDIEPRNLKSSICGSKRTFERAGGSLGKGVLCMEYSDCGMSRYHLQFCPSTH
jgi:hypothetical protein